MNNTSSIIRVSIVFISVVLFFSYGFYDILLKPEKQTIEDNIEYVNIFDNYYPDDGTKTSIPSNTEATDVQSTIKTSAAGEVLGKVYNKTIKNSTANLSYNGVYVKNSTDLKINIRDLLSDNLTFKITKNSQPQVLIVHTHATESFLNEDRDYYTTADKSRNTDNSKNVTALGSIVAEKLNAAGIITLHDSTQHDYPSYNESYSRAAKTIKAYIKNYPSIRVVIDIHRDCVQSGDDKTKLTAEINGRKAAQIMLVMGSQSGNVKNFPNWKENLKLALRLQKNLESMYPELSRPLSLMSRSYNEPLTTGSMLIEIGTDANSFFEAEYSAELLANSLIETLGS